MNPDVIVTPSVGVSVFVAALGGWLLGSSWCAWRHPDIRRMKALCALGYDYRQMADDAVAAEEAWGDQ